MKKKTQKTNQKGEEGSAWQLGTVFRTVVRFFIPEMFTVGFHAWRLNFFENGPARCLLWANPSMQCGAVRCGFDIFQNRTVRCCDPLNS